MKSYQVIIEVWYSGSEKPVQLDSDIFPKDYLGLDHYREVVDEEREDFDLMEGEIVKETIKLISFDEERELVSNDPELYKTWTENEEVIEKTELIYQ